MAQETPERSRSLNILSFDAGGPRGISQLQILENIMLCISCGDGDDCHNKVKRPFEVFDAIGGVGTGGLIAIFLVILRLTATEALELFTKFTGDVYINVDRDPKVQTAKLNKAIHDILKTHGINRHMRLVDPSQESACKLIVHIMYKGNVRSTAACVLRNHCIRDEPAIDLTIAEAMLATCATPPVFTPTKITSKDRSFCEYVGGDAGLSNPTREIIAETLRVFEAGRNVACVLSIGPGHPGVNSVPVNSRQSSWVEFYQRAASDGESIAHEISRQFSKLNLYFRLSVTNGMQGLIGGSTTDLDNIASQTAAYLEDQEVVERVQRCADAIRFGDGLATLEHLGFSGGAKVIAPSMPPLAQNYVDRAMPMELVKNAIFSDDGAIKPGPKIVVVTGIGGSGKTQLIRKIIEKYGDHFISTFFIDGSSKAAIQRDIVRYVRSVGSDSQASFSDAMEFLSEADPRGERLGVIDNVNDDKLDLSPFLPRWANGTIIITSRSTSCGQLSAATHLKLEDMSHGEAIKMMALGLGQSDPSESDIAAYTKLVVALYCHPIALAQAISYMYATGVKADGYITRMLEFRGQMLDIPATHQVEMRYKTAYAAFDASYDLLSPKSKHTCHFLSFFDSQRFPVGLIELAAEDNFSTIEHEYMPEGEAFERGKKCLDATFRPFGQPHQLMVDSIVAELQSQTFVTCQSTNAVMLLQMHPLVHEWARFRIAAAAFKDFQDGATRLICCGAKDTNFIMAQYLSHHVQKIVSECEELHVNAIASFSLILSASGAYHEAAALLERLRERLQSQLGSDHRSTIYATENLAQCYEELGRFLDAKVLRQTEKLREKTAKFGATHPKTILQSSKLALLLEQQRTRLNDDVEGQDVEIEWMRRQLQELGHVQRLERSESNSAGGLINMITAQDDPTSESTEVIIATVRQSRQLLRSGSPESILSPTTLDGTLNQQMGFVAAAALETEFLRQTQQAMGPDHPNTWKASEDLADKYCRLGRYEEAEELMKVVHARREVCKGAGHPETIKASKNLATIYIRMGAYDKASVLQKEIIRQRELTLGERHEKTLFAMLCLSQTYVAMSHREDAYLLAKGARDTVLDTLGDRHRLYQYASDVIACVGAYDRRQITM